MSLNVHSPGEGSIRPSVLLAVAVLILSSVAIIPSQSEDSDASTAAPAGKHYAYCVEYDDETGEITGVKDLMDSGASMTATSTSSQGSWTWSDATGLGPFNMFYAAINVTDNGDAGRLSDDVGHVAYILKPSDLTETLDDDTWTMSDYNIMLIIPTVYWCSDGAGKLYISDTPDNRFLPSGIQGDGTSADKMFPYAHRTDGTQTYPYLGIGVYEATLSGGKLLSKSTGASPTVSQTLTSFRSGLQDVPDGSGTYQIWNLYEWTLYKILAQTVIGGNDSQGGFDYGNTYGSEMSSTGLGDKAGPYAGNAGTSKPASTTASTYVKLFIENAWGSAWDYVDNAYVDHGSLKAGSGLVSNLSGDASTITNGVSGKDYTRGSISIPNVAVTGNKPIITTYLSSAAWDIPETNAESGSGAANDGMYSYTGHNSGLYIGGSAWTEGSAGLSCWASNRAVNGSNTDLGARLSYMMTMEAVVSTPAGYYNVTYLDTSFKTERVEQYYSVLLPVPAVPEGYTFEGWYADPECIQYIGPAGGPYTPKSSATLYALYTQSESFEITAVYTLDGSPSDLETLKTKCIDEKLIVPGTVIEGTTEYVTIVPLSNYEFTVSSTDAFVRASAGGLYSVVPRDGAESITIGIDCRTLQQGVGDFGIATINNGNRGAVVILEASSSAGLLEGNVHFRGVYCKGLGTGVSEVKAYGAIVDSGIGVRNGTSGYDALDSSGVVVEGGADVMMIDASLLDGSASIYAIQACYSYNWSGMTTISTELAVIGDLDLSEGD